MNFQTYRGGLFPAELRDWNAAHISGTTSGEPDWGHVSTGYYAATAAITLMVTTAPVR